MNSIPKKFLAFGALALLLIIITYAIYATQFNYWRLLYFLKVAQDVSPIPYELQFAPATSTVLVFNTIQLAVPWSDISLSKTDPDMAQWSTTDSEKYLTLFLSTTTTRVIWKENPSVKDILPIDTLSSYELERMIWRVQLRESPLWVTKNNEATKKIMLATIKKAKYSWCDKLLEFQNQYEVKGVICDWVDKEGEKKSIVYFYISNDDSEYNFIVKPDRVQIRDSIIASIKKK